MPLSTECTEYSNFYMHCIFLLAPWKVWCFSFSPLLFSSHNTPNNAPYFPIWDYSVLTWVTKIADTPAPFWEWFLEARSLVHSHEGIEVRFSFILKNCACVVVFHPANGWFLESYFHLDVCNSKRASRKFYFSVLVKTVTYVNANTIKIPWTRLFTCVVGFKERICTFQSIIIFIGYERKLLNAQDRWAR